MAVNDKSSIDRNMGLSGSNLPSPVREASHRAYSIIDEYDTQTRGARPEHFFKCSPVKEPAGSDAAGERGTKSGSPQAPSRFEPGNRNHIERVKLIFEIQLHKRL